MPFQLPTGGVQKLTLTFSDDGGDTSTKIVDVPWDTDLATTMANAIALANLYKPVTNGGLAAEMRVIFTDSAPQLPAINSKVNTKAGISMTLLTTGNQTQDSITLEIPSPDAALRLALTGPQKYIVDVANADLVALTNEYKTGGTAVIGDGQEVDQVLSGTIYDKKSHKRRS